MAFTPGTGEYGSGEVGGGGEEEGYIEKQTNKIFLYPPCTTYLKFSFKGVVLLATNNKSLIKIGLSLWFLS